jgi:hypothetical protein
MYTDSELDIGVVHVGGGYRINWDDYTNPYWVPLAIEDIEEIRYVVNWGTPEQSIYVERYTIDKLPELTRSGEYLEQAFQRMIEYTGQDVEISIVPINYEGTIEDTIFMSNGYQFVSERGTDLDKAKWQLVGLWGLENIKDIFNPSYLKIANESGVFLIDEKTFLIL